MHKKLTLNQTTLCADGSIGLQWLKQVVDETTGEVMLSEPHRSIIDIDADIDEQVANVSNHLVSMGYPPVSTAMLARIKATDSIGKEDAEIIAARAQKLAQRKSDALKAMRVKN